MAVLYVSDVEEQMLQRSEPLRKLYALTQAEVELVELLCDGSSLEESAAHRGVTLNTARSQLKQIFQKTGHEPAERAGAAGARGHRADSRSWPPRKSSTRAVPGDAR